MLKVGLTGGIGSGKSTASKYFEKLGAFIFDADSEAKNLISTNDLVQHELITEFGTDIIDASGKINKEKLSRIAFQDVDHQRQLNSVVHPYVFDLLDKSFDKKLKKGDHEVFLVDGANFDWTSDPKRQPLFNEPDMSYGGAKWGEVVPQLTGANVSFAMVISFGFMVK